MKSPLPNDGPCECSETAHTHPLAIERAKLIVSSALVNLQDCYTETILDTVPDLVQLNEFKPIWSSVLNPYAPPLSYNLDM